MQNDHTRSLLKSQGSSRSCRQDTALGVHYGRNVVVAWKRSPVAVPGRDRRFRQSHPTVSCSPCHVHHKSVGGRLLKTRPWPATRKALQSTSPTRAPYLTLTESRSIYLSLCFISMYEPDDRSEALLYEYATNLPCLCMCVRASSRVRDAAAVAPSVRCRSPPR